MKRRITSAAASFWKRPQLSADRLVALQPRRILLVRQHNQMGDMVCATPCFRAIRETWPQAETALVTAPVNRDVVANNPHLNRLFLFEQRLWRRPLRFAKFIRDVRAYGADLAIVLNSVSFSATSAFLALWSGARHVVGGDSAPFGSGVARAYSLRMPSLPELDRHSIDHSLEPLAAVGIGTADRSTVVVPSAQQDREAATLIRELLAGAAYWALHPGAGKRQNIWPPDRFAAVAARVAGAGTPVLVLHGPSDRQELAAFQETLNLPPHAAPVVVTPPISVGTGAALIAGAGRFLCNDTGVMHVAGAVGTPTLALFGVTDPAIWKPPGDQVVTLRASTRQPDSRGDEYGWLETLTVDQVHTAWRDLNPASNT